MQQYLTNGYMYVLCTCIYNLLHNYTGVIRYSGRSIPVSVLYSASHRTGTVTHPDIAVLLVEGDGVLKTSNKILNTVEDYQVILLLKISSRYSLRATLFLFS